jgi:MoaA/NifB/PqqE/SkfB family radical SAM enzyme
VTAFSASVLLRAAWAEGRRLVTGAPHSAEVDVTDRCNLRCPHCYHFHGKRIFRRDEVPRQAWRARFQRLHAEGIRFLLLVGGEPALRPDVLAEAAGTFIRVYAITNGTLPVPRGLALRLFVSLDGLEATHDSLRGPGVFRRVLANYAGDERVVVNMTLGEHNLADLEAVLGLARGLGWRGVVCNLVTAVRSGRGPRALDGPARARVLGELRRVKARHPGELLLSESMIAWYARADHRDACYWGDGALHFDVDWRPRRCFAEADCSRCGCLGGALQSPRHLLAHPRELLALV